MPARVHDPSCRELFLLLSSGLCLLHHLGIHIDLSSRLAVLLYDFLSLPHSAAPFSFSGNQALLFLPRLPANCRRMYSSAHPVAMSSAHASLLLLRAAARLRFL